MGVCVCVTPLLVNIITHKTILLVNLIFGLWMHLIEFKNPNVLHRGERSCQVNRSYFETMQTR